MNYLKLGLATTLAFVTSMQAYAAPAEVPFSTLVFEIGNQYDYNHSAHRQLIISKNPRNGLTTFQTCAGPLGSGAACTILGSSEGYTNMEMEQLQKQLNKKSRLYTVFVGAPAALCGALLGGVALPALVLGGGIGIGELSGGGVPTLVLGYLGLLASPVAAVIGALGGFEFFTKTVNSFFNAGSEVYAPKSTVKAAQYLKKPEGILKKFFTGEIREVEDELNARGKADLFTGQAPSQRTGFIEVHGDPVIVARKIELALESIRGRP